MAAGPRRFSIKARHFILSDELMWILDFRIRCLCQGFLTVQTKECLLQEEQLPEKQFIIQPGTFFSRDLSLAFLWEGCFIFLIRQLAALNSALQRFRMSSANHSCFFCERVWFFPRTCYLKIGSCLFVFSVIGKNVLSL